MRFPLHIATDMMRWQLKNWWAGNAHVPVVLMLEPLHTCNLACIGCSPERYTGDLKDRLPLEKCFAAIEECGAPMVSICGGEPTIYPELVELIEGIIERRKHAIMCTKGILELSRRYPKISSTPLFLEFAAGLRDYPCTPWGNPTYTPKGWKGPCYLIEGKYYGSWKEFFGGVDWDYWESRQDPRCHNCKMHSGFEPSVVRKLGGSPRDMLTMARWQLKDVRNSASRLAKA